MFAGKTVWFLSGDYFDCLAKDELFLLPPEVEDYFYSLEGDMRPPEPIHFEPCPFCGETEDMDRCVNDEDLTWVECNSCGATGPTAYLDDEEVEKWNKRC